MRSHIPEMGGQHYVGDAVDKDWRVTKDNQTLKLEYQDSKGQSQTESIRLKLGDRIEQVATYINAQQSIASASVTENNELQFLPQR